MQKVVLITTGGTIEKTYDEATGELQNRRSIVCQMLKHLRLVDIETPVVEVMSKDSLFLTDEDRATIVANVHEHASNDDAPDLRGIVILHGTDTLEKTGEAILASGSLPVPVVLTGAMRPFEMKESDALQNLTEAIFATGMLKPGVYCAAHGRVLRFPGVRKDRDRGTFVQG